jgi:hypothetical protein
LEASSPTINLSNVISVKKLNRQREASRCHLTSGIVQTAGLNEYKGECNGRTKSKTGIGKAIQQDVGGAYSPLPTRD